LLYSQVIKVLIDLNGTNRLVKNPGISLIEGLFKQNFETESEYALCRCGKSRNMPFCDESHKRTGLDRTETASLVPYARQAEEFDGPTLVLSDAENLCAFARFCDPGGKIWGLIEQTDDPEVRDLYESIGIRKINPDSLSRLFRNHLISTNG
jgi:CDGSH-type Zn-finger protein